MADKYLVLVLALGFAWMPALGADAPREKRADSLLFATYSEVGPLLHRVDLSGRIERVELQFAPNRDAGYHQSPLPLVSPDERWIAYTRDNDLWIHDTEYESQMAITKAGRPGTEGSMEVFVTAHTWSPDSRYLIYHIGHSSNEGSCNCSGRPIPKKRDAAYGYYRYDMQRGKTLPLDESAVLTHYLMVEHVAWLGAETFLVKSQAAPETTEFPVAPRKVKAGHILYSGHRSPSNYFRVSSDGENFEFVGGFDGNAFQEVISRDQARLAAYVSKSSKREEPRAAGIWTLDLKSGKAAPMTIEGVEEHRHQSPRFSPDGETIAYMCSVPECEDEACRRRIAVHRLAMKGKIVANCGWYGYSLEWLDDRTVALSCNNELRVIDWKSKQVLGRIDLPRSED